MRIIGGSYKGKKIAAPAHLPVRPTTDFAKTGIFNILSTHYDISGCKVLDLYSGTGALTYEFLSRGCMRIQSIDRNKDCISFITSTLGKLGAPASVRAVQADAVTYLKKNTDQFDIILADPPFDMDVAAELSEAIFSHNKLLPGGVFVLEHITGRNYMHLPGFQETRKYGNVSFSLFSNGVMGKD